MRNKKNSFENLNTFLYKQIKDMIWNKQLLPGDKIIQEQLAAELGVSRTPLIKVLERLTTERLIDYIPRRGYFVKRLTLEEMIEIFKVREVVEGVAAKEVAEKASGEEITELKNIFAEFDVDKCDECNQEYIEADQKFHSRLIEIANIQLLEDINEMFNIYRFSYQKGLMRDPSETLMEHQEILKKIEEHDSRKAQLLVMDHIEKSSRNISNIYQEKYKQDGTLK